MKMALMYVNGNYSIHGLEFLQMLYIYIFPYSLRIRADPPWQNAILLHQRRRGACPGCAAPMVLLRALILRVIKSSGASKECELRPLMPSLNGPLVVFVKQRSWYH